MPKISLKYLNSFAVAGVAMLVLMPVPLHGQSSLATVLGRVTDSSGAVVTNATVVLTNEKTNISHTQTSTNEGQYVFPNIDPGIYQIKTTAQGFTAYSLNDIKVDVSQIVREDIHLSVGSVSSTVQVRATAPLVQTDSSSVGSVIEGSQINQMPLDDRTTIFGLLALSPGVQSAGSNARISGNSWIGTNETMDGVNNMEGENERLSTEDPSLESIQEFRVIDSTGSAKYGNGTAQVILSTKSGTNDFHGSLFGYNRNRVLTAHNYFDPPGSVKPPYDRNQFGASLGGPIKRNRLFFFGSFEGLLFHSSDTNTSQQPTTAMLSGNFANQPPVIDPTTGQPFPNNQIPSDRISTISQKFFQFFDTPNITTSNPAGLGNNYVVPVGAPSHDYRYEGRVDYAISPKDSAFVRYYYTDYPNFSPGPTEKIGGNTTSLTQWSVAANYTHTFTPNLVNLATFGKIYTAENYLSQNNSLNASSFLTGLVPPPPGYGGIPTVSINNFTGVTDYGSASALMPTYQADDALTWTRGTHTIELGGGFLRSYFYNEGLDGPQNGSLQFTGQYTGNSFADFLLGYLAGSSNSLGSVYIGTLNYRRYIYAEDSWRVTPRLTLNYGLRYDFPTLYTNTNGGMANWYPNLNQMVVITGTYAPDGYPGLPIVSGSSVGINTGNYINNDLSQVAPRFGFIFRPFDTTKLIVRGGYGIYYESMPWKFGAFELGANPPFLATQNFEPAAGNTPTLLISNPFPANSGIPGESSAFSISAEDKDMHYPYTDMWNFTIESQVSANTAFRATYLGSERIHSGALGAPNTPPQAPGPVQPRRPYQPFGNISYYDNFQTSSTNQLQLSAQRSFSNGLSYGVEYAWTKTLNAVLYDMSQPTDPQFPNYDRGNDPQILQQYAVGNYVYELPFGTNKRFLATSPALVKAVLGNWETSGIVTVGGGYPYTVNFNSSVQGWTSSHANIIGNPHVSHPSLQEWFNPAAFTLPAPFTWGNAGANNYFGPKYFDWDMGVFKNFILKDNYRLQFRAEAFNWLNHPNFNNPDSTITDIGSVGTISGADNGRDMQFALRLDF